MPQLLPESRVYCQDRHATQWIPLGISCPLTCFNIRAAIEWLKIADADAMIEAEFTSNLRSSNGTKEKTLPFLKQSLRSMNDPPNTTKQENADPFEDKKLLNALKQEIKQLATNKYDKNCALLLKKQKFKPHLEKMVMEKCSRRSMGSEEDFLHTLTALLNKYTGKHFKFTEDIIAALLHELLGKNTDLREGVLDVQKLIKFMHKAISQHKDIRGRNIIRIQSTHCLTIHISGCFCKPGFVEDRGQCVVMDACVEGHDDARYLKRLQLA